MKKKTIPVDANASGELIDSKTIWNENIRSYEFHNYKRTFWFRKETGLLVDDCNNNMVWPGLLLYEWIEKNNGISWYLSSGCNYILVEITNQNTCSRFIKDFFPESVTPDSAVGEYSHTCKGRKTFWLRPTSRLVRVYGQLVYFEDDFYDWKDMNGVTTRTSITGDFLIVSISEGTLVDDFRRKIVNHINFTQDRIIKNIITYHNTIRLLFFSKSIFSFYFKKWIEHTIIIPLLSSVRYVIILADKTQNINEISQSLRLQFANDVWIAEDRIICKRLRFILKNVPYFRIDVDIRGGENNAYIERIFITGIRTPYLNVELSIREHKHIYLSDRDRIGQDQEISLFAEILVNKYSFVSYN